MESRRDLCFAGLRQLVENHLVETLQKPILLSSEHPHPHVDQMSFDQLSSSHVLLVYLITTRIATTIVAFGLASDRRDKRRCTRLLYWGSTLLVLASLATLIVAVCLLGHVTLSQRQRGKSHRLLPATLQI